MSCTGFFCPQAQPRNGILEGYASASALVPVSVASSHVFTSCFRASALCLQTRGRPGLCGKTWKDLAYDADNRSTGIIGIKLNHDI